MPTMSQFRILEEELSELKRQLKVKRVKDEEETSTSSSSSEEINNVIIDDANMSRLNKLDIIEAALPLDSNGQFANILFDHEGASILEEILKAALNKAVQEEGATFDTSTKKTTLASKVVHVLFSIRYVLRYKAYDPRPNYMQAPGTAMTEQIYKWLMNAMESIAMEFYESFGIPSKFDWSKFFVMMRAVWRWTRSNNSEMRRVRRRKNPKEGGKKKGKKSKN